jgi:leucyl/phenylalanyl-tRNA--protein transferase
LAWAARSCDHNGGTEHDGNDTLIPWLRGHAAFPPIENALAEPNGLLAAGGDLSPQRLLAAYSQGIFPWYSEGQPILWWSPDPRMVLHCDELKVARSLRRTVASQKFEIRVDTAFQQVISECSLPRRGHYGTWIMPEMINAYTQLHALGHAHSVEAWRDGVLVGGLYGVSLGRMFFGESMFAHESDASKVSLVHLVAMLKERAMPMIDCQQDTEHLARLGARPIARRVFAKALDRLVNCSEPDRPWSGGQGAEHPDDQTQ